uniref:Uncharacterized protein n=1 Tax=viral metagenome TaxID=1070528 RepID=A0A6C0JFH1_9ZZZZ
MSSSSRSIAAARQKRAGEQSQPMNTSRPVTSISSQGAFAQQQQYQQQMMSQSIPVGSKNVRVAQNRAQGPGGRGNPNVSDQQEQSTKISVSNAIGLITLRLGKLEKFIHEVNEEGGFSNNGGNDMSGTSMPPNMKLVSDEVFENIVNRLNLLESKVINFTSQNENFAKDISNIHTSIINLNSNLSFFMNETNQKFVDYENALGEIEKNFEVDNNLDMVNQESEVTYMEEINTNNETNTYDESLENNDDNDDNDENNENT